MNNSNRKSYDAKFKSRVALEAIKSERTSAELTAIYGVHGSQITKWKKQAIEGLYEVFSRSETEGNRRPRVSRGNCTSRSVN